MVEKKINTDIKLLNKIEREKETHYHMFAKYLVTYISKRETCRYGRKLFAIHLFKCSIGNRTIKDTTYRVPFTLLMVFL